MLALGSDHGGFELKEKVKDYLVQKGIRFADYGVFSTNPADYPDIAKEVCADIVNGKCRSGILFCGTGIGISIAANKINGIRAALCHNEFEAKMAKQHNDANVLCLGGRVIGSDLAFEIVDVFLKEVSLGGRHQRRVDKIMALQNNK